MQIHQFNAVNNKENIVNNASDLSDLPSTSSNTSNNQLRYEPFDSIESNRNGNIRSPQNQFQTELTHQATDDNRDIQEVQHDVMKKRIVTPDDSDTSKSVPQLFEH